MRIVFAALLLCLPLANLQAEPPTLKITGPNVAKSSQLIVLDLDTDADEGTIEWDIPGLSSDQWATSPDKRRAYVVAAPGNYSAIVYGAKYEPATEGEGTGKNRSGIGRYILVVSGVAPVPGPGPTPGPVPPVEVFGMTSWTRAEVAKLSANAQTRKAAFAAAARTVAAQMDAGQFASIAECNSALGAALLVACTPYVEDWSPFMAKGSGSFPKKLNSLNTEGRLQTIPELAAVIREVAAGME